VPLKKCLPFTVALLKLLKMDATASFEKVCAALGGRVSMAQFFSVTDAALSQWKKDGFPPHRAIEVERRLKGKIRAADLAVTEPKKKARG